MEFKDRLHALRIENHLTLQELGEKVGLGKEAIYKYEKGLVVNPKRDLVAKLAKIFNVSPCYMLCLSDDRYSESDKFTQAEMNVIILFRKLNADGQDFVIEQINYALGKDFYVKKEEPKAVSL